LVGGQSGKPSLRSVARQSSGRPETVRPGCSMEGEVSVAVQAVHKRIRDESRFALEFVRKEGLAKTGVAIPRLDATFSGHLVKGSAWLQGAAFAECCAQTTGCRAAAHGVPMTSRKRIGRGQQVGSCRTERRCDGCIRLWKQGRARQAAVA